MKCFALLLTLLCLPAVASETATVAGRFVVVGELAKPAAIVVEKDPFCEKCQPVDETVLVGADGGLANAVVWVRVPRGRTLPLPEGDAAAIAEPLELTNKRCRFSPRVSLLRVGQPLVLKNADPTAHNTKIGVVRSGAVNSVIPAKGEVRVVMERAESRPAPVSCSIHPFMRGHVLVRADPFMAVSGADGRFTISGLPPGEHQLQLWHETGSLADSETALGATDRRGRLRISVEAGGTTDLGEVRISASTLRP